MKATFIHEQIEYRLEVEGDEKIQGDSLKGVFVLKNHNGTHRTIAAPYVHLAIGEIKKVKERAADAFEVTSSAGDMRGVEIPPEGETRFPFAFQLERNATITDKAQSVFLLFGSEEGATGELRVTVRMHPHIRALVELLESSHQFVYKGEKSSNGWVRVKLKPPSARRMSLVNELTLSARFDGDALELEYLFAVKRLDASVSSLAMKRAKEVVLQRFDPSEYLVGGQYLDHQFLVEKAGAAIATVASEL
jgi:hypothetical protein